MTDGSTRARRHLIAGVASLAVAKALPALAADGPLATKRIGLLHSGGRSYRGLPQALGLPLRDLGLSTSFEVRSAEGQKERLSQLVAELIAARVDILLIDGDAHAVRAAMQATSTVPIVFLSIGDPVAEGLVQSLARPGGNVTGLSSQAPELEAKRLDLLAQAVPTIRRVALITNPSNRALVSASKMIQEVGFRLSLALSVFEVTSSSDMAQALRSIARDQVDALIQGDDWLLNDHLAQTGVFALERRLPFAAAYLRHGVLVAYGARAAEEEERQLVRAIYRLASGTRPSDLPIEQPTTFTLSVNLNVADALRITVPAAFLLRADRVGRWPLSWPAVR